ncbi:hypothetical protein D3C71_1890520 [compost metagenome]
MPPCCIAWLDRPFSKAGPRISFAPMDSSQNALDTRSTISNAMPVMAASTAIENSVPMP